MSRSDSITPLRERMGLTLAVAYVSTGFAQLVGQLFFFFVLQYLSVESVGLYGLAVAVATIATYVADFGLSTFLIGELAQSRYRLRPVIELVCLTRIPVVLVGIVSLQVWTYLASPTSEEYRTIALIGLAYVIQMWDVGLTPWLQTRERQNAVNLVALIVPLGRLAGIGVPLLLGFGLSLSTVVMVFVAAQLAGTISLLALCVAEERRNPTGLDTGVLALLSKFKARGPGLAVMYAANVVQTRVDWLLVSALISRVALANYSLANKIIESVMLLAAVWAKTTFPWLSRTDADEPHLRARLSLLRRLFIVSSGFVGVALFFWAVPLLGLLFGDKYAAANSSILLMTVATPIFMLNQYLLYLVLSTRLEAKYTYVIVATTIVQVVLDIVLIPRMGILGAAVGMIAMALGLHAGQMVLLCRQGVIAIEEFLRMELLLICTMGGLAISWLVAINPLVGTLLGAIVVGLVGGFVVLGVQDRHRLVDWVARRSTSTSAA